MPPKCLNKPPTFRVNMHLPATNWHPHKDETFQIKNPTEWEAWAYMMRATLMELTHGNLRLMVGYWADAMNVLPVEARTALIHAIAKGLGLQIKPVEDVPDSIEVNLVQRYDPLMGDKTTESGLVLPGGKPGGGSKLVLPGSQ